MIRRPPRSTQSRSSAASDVYKRQGCVWRLCTGHLHQKRRGWELRPLQYRSPQRKRRSPPTAECGVDDCSLPGIKRGGWCKRHYSLDDQYWKKHALTLREAIGILRDQNGLCALCDHPISFTARPGSFHPSAALDHDHETLTVRGILCGACNKIEGLSRGGHWSLEKFSSRLEAYRARGRT